MTGRSAGRPRLEPALLAAASAPYRPAGRFAYHFARGKLNGDPAFGAIMASDWIASGDRIIDLGCGQGLLAALLWAAERDCRVDGIELMAADVDRAQVALAVAIAQRRASFVCDDIRHAAFGHADVAVVLDVLHYIDYDDQRRVLERLRDALSPRGLLLLRVGDASAGLPFRISNWVDRTVTFVRGHRLGRLYCRPLIEWRAALAALGFAVRAIPLSQGTPFANVLLEARAR
ncbi:MAG: class I SAM-dependent methyltransferase [Burkholderiaceae bacterium]